MSALGYVIVTFNQASGQPELECPELHDDLDSAALCRDEAQRQTDTAGRRERHVVAEVVELDESEA